ncbi:purine and uridine phosphorylase [Sarocladium strictum]
MGSHAEQDAPEAMRSSSRKRGLTVDDVESSDPAPKRHSPSRRPALANSCYTVAMICPLPLEKAAAMAMLDEEHQPLRSRCSDNDNTYTLGSIHTEQGTHHVVIAGMGIGNIGILPASTVARHLQQTFPQARLCLVVGIGGGVPSKSHPLRLGDVVVGAKVIPYDAQRVLEHGVVRNGRTLLPPDVLLNAASSLKAQHYVSESGIQSILGEKRDQLARFQRPSLQDRLFRSDYLHVSGETGDADGDSDSDPCNSCDLAMVHERSPRQSTSPSIHIGDIASGGTLLRSSHMRESLGRGELNVLCFEMETAGIMQVLPCLPIRGIADYADSHKNKRWQRYAAATAAAYARELLESIPPLSPGERNASQPPTIPSTEGLSVPLTVRKDQFMASLRFDRMGLRRQGVDTPESSTCEWLLAEPHVVKWLDDTRFQEHSGLLLLTGNAGTGKSTCVNSLFEWHKRQSPVDGAAPLFASFFFHNRGVELEKSVVGMYRTLLLQLFTGYPDLLDVLNDFSFQTVGSVVRQCPSLQTLQNLFKEALLSLRGRAFVCYIDALDEGNVQDVRDIVSFFQNMATHPGIRTKRLFRVMFSSRPYPFVIRRWLGTHFALEQAEGHRRDLEHYVQHHLQDAEPIIIETILEKANGVFLWVKLVSRVFFEDYLSQSRPCDLERLRDTPNELKDLFQDMLERDKSNWDEFSMAMTWILYARKPLKLRQFSIALDLGMQIQQLDTLPRPRSRAEMMPC